jgi:hypothetical protein
MVLVLRLCWSFVKKILAAAYDSGQQHRSGHEQYGCAAATYSFSVRAAG